MYVYTLWFGFISVGGGVFNLGFAGVLRGLHLPFRLVWLLPVIDVIFLVN